MKIKFFYGLVAAIAAPAVYSQIVINEVDADTSGADTLEFIELFDGGAGNTPLDNLVLVLVNGSDDRSYGDAFNLNGLTTDANGYFVIGNPDVPNVDFTFDPGAAGALQNGVDAVALYAGDATSFPNDTDVTTENLVDSIVYTNSNDAADDSGLLGIFGGIQYSENENDLKDTHSLQRNPNGNGAGNFGAALATPGAVNLVPPPLAVTISLDATSIGESSLDSITVTVSRSTMDGDLDVFVTLDDDTEAEISGSSPVMILDGDTSAEVTIFPVDDRFPDGDQIVTFTADPVGGPPVSDAFTVTDDAGDVFTLIFNEINSVAQEDLNGDGLVDNDDDFVEILNISGATVDLSEYEILEGTSGASVHFFPEGTILDDGCSVVVGGSGFIPGSESARYGTAFVQNASEGSALRITDTGDRMRLLNSSFQEIHSVAIPDLSGSPELGSWALAMDGEVASGYAQHSEISTPSSLSSPGVGLDGEPFCTVSTSITVTASPASIVEDAGADSVTATVSIPSALTTDLAVFVFSTDLSGISSREEAQVTGLIAAGDTSVDITLDAVDDEEGDGTQSVTLIAGGLGYLNGTTSVDVQDDGNDPVALQVCDIAFVGLAADTPDAFAFVALVDIGGSTIINFTDKGWISDASGFRSAEGVLSWTAPATGIPAGTVVTITNNSPYGAASSAGPDGGAVVEISGGGPGLATTGDQIFAYQGTLEEPSILAGITIAGPWVALGDSTNNSALPGVLASAGAIFIDPETDNVAYTGSTTAVDVASFKALLFNPANFASGNAREDVTFPSGSFIFGGPSDYNVTVSDCSASGGQFVINFTATGSSDVYVTSDLQNWSAATDGAGVDSGLYTDTAPFTGKAFYIIQEAGAPAP